MHELGLTSCPICLARDCLSRETLKGEGQTYVWYKCRECDSILQWAGGNQWTYQSITRKDKAHLLNQPMTPSELRALLPEGRANVHDNVIPSEVVICELCGASNPNTATVCHNCNGKISPITKRCPYCSEVIQAAAIVCKHCGRPMPGHENEIPAPIIPQTVVPVARRRKRASILIFLLALLPFACLALGVVLVIRLGWFEELLQGGAAMAPEELCVVKAQPYVAQVESLLGDWDDANRLASSTSRIALSPAIASLQDIRRKASDLDWGPKCSAAMRQPLLDYMDKTIEGYLAFMADDPDSTVQRIFEEASEKLADYTIANLTVTGAMPVVTPSRGAGSSTLSKALRGHWVTDGDETHYYFSSSELVRVSQGTTSTFRYAVLEANDKDNILCIQLENPETGLGHGKVLKFSEDRKQIAETTTALGVSIDSNWTYVDRKQKP